jgi:outer membrane receptor protein involved in Fe transport
MTNLTPLLTPRLSACVFALSIAHTGLFAQSSPAPQPASEESIKLSPFEVKADSNVGYGAAETLSSSRLATAYIDVPQTMNVVTEEFLRDAAVFNVRDSLQWVNNVETNSENHFPGVVMRGIQVANNFYIEGFRLPESVQNIDTFFTSRIEVVKGPTSVGVGRGDPAGFINYMIKKPDFTRRIETGLMVGSEDNLRTTFDFQDVLGASKTVGLRLIGFKHSGSFNKELSDFDKMGGMLALSARIGKKTKLNIYNTYADEEVPSDVNTVLYTDPTYRLAVSKLLGRPEILAYPYLKPKDALAWPGGKFKNRNWNLLVIAEQTLAEWLNARFGFNRQAGDHEGLVFFDNLASISTDPATGQTTAGMNAWFETRSHLSRSYQADFIFRFDRFLGGVLKGVTGFEHSESDRFSARPSAAPRGPSAGGRWILATLDETPVPALSFPDPYNFAGARDIASTSYSYFAGINYSFWKEQIILDIQGRKSWSESLATRRDTGAITDSNKNHTDIAPRFSASYKPKPWLTIYGLDSVHLEPSFLANAWGQLPPGDSRNGQQKLFSPDTRLREGGIKSSFLNGKVIASVAYYHQLRIGNPRNVMQVERLPDGTQVTVFENLSTKDDSSGVEFEVFGRPTPHITLMGGFAFGESTTDMAGSLTGERGPSESSIDTITTHVKYDFKRGGREGLSLRIGAKCWLSGWQALARAGANTSFPDNQYTVDIGGSYGWKRGRYTVDLKVNNALNSYVVTRPNFALPLRMVYLSFGGRW